MSTERVGHVVRRNALEAIGAGPNALSEPCSDQLDCGSARPVSKVIKAPAGSRLVDESRAATIAAVALTDGSWNDGLKLSSGFG